MAKQLDEQVQRLNSSFTPRQREALDKFMGIIRNRPCTPVKYHEAALLLKIVCKKQTEYSFKWAEALNKLIEDKGVKSSESLLYRLTKFAELYPGKAGRDQIKDLDGRVSWESMYRLFSIEDETVREEILRKAYEKNLSSRQVIAVIQERIGYRKPRPSQVRQPKPPNSTHPNSALRNLRSLALKWQLVSKAWLQGKNSAFERSSRLKTQMIPQDWLDDLDAARGDVQEMAVSAQELSSKLVELQDMLDPTRSRN